jgi:hypothetical protein
MLVRQLEHLYYTEINNNLQSKSPQNFRSLFVTICIFIQVYLL